MVSYTSTTTMSRAAGADAAMDGSDQMQQRIAIARRDAEALKDRIRRRKDELADTTCENLLESVC